MHSKRKKEHVSERWHHFRNAIESLDYTAHAATNETQKYTYFCGM